MSNWANQFQDLKNQFVTRSKERLVAIETLLTRLQTYPTDTAILRQIMTHFHWLAGSGGTYGFDDITQWGTYGEELCDYLLKLDAPVSAADYDKLATALRTVDQLFAVQPAQTSPQQAESAELPQIQQKPKSTQDLLTPSSGLANSMQQAANNPNLASLGSKLNSNSGTYNTTGQHNLRDLNNNPGYNTTGQHNLKDLNNNPSYNTTGQHNLKDLNNNPSYNTTGQHNLKDLNNNPSYNTTGQHNLRDLNNNATSGNPPGSTGFGPSSGPANAGLGFSNTMSANPAGTFANKFPASSAGPPVDTPLPGTPGSQISNAMQNTADNAGYTAPPRSSSSAGSNPTMQNPGMQNPARGQTNPLSSDNRSTGQFPAQTFPAATPADSTRVLDSGARMPMSTPPMTSGIDNSNLFVPGAAPGFPGSPETRTVSRLGHIPTDRKFAILIDGNMGNLGPMKAPLEEQEIIVEQFGTAGEVKALFSERLPDVLILSAPLPDNNGYDLVEYLRSLESGHRPIVILLGQQAAFLDKVRAIRAGADAFFEYPSELTEAIQKLQMLLERDKIDSYKILSVEDDPDMAAFIKLTLSSAGYTVLHIADPKTFEDQFLSFEPDLVMLDVLLGDLTGFELAKYIRQNDRFATLPIVFLTTQNKLHQHIRSAIAGGDEHLIKPVAPQLLIATIASRLERARALKRLIDRDGLTRCLNYGSFMERAQKLAGPEGYRTAPAMMMIDVDNMKKINEQLGFAAGDRIISSIANMLLKGFRNTDLIARFGNDQFAIVLEHLNTKQLHDLSSEVLKAISSTPQMVKGRPVYVTCSGGVAVLEQGMSVQNWLSAAQDSLKKAKDAGGNRAVLNPRT